MEGKYLCSLQDREITMLEEDCISIFISRLTLNCSSFLTYDNIIFIHTHFVNASLYRQRIFHQIHRHYYNSQCGPRTFNFFILQHLPYRHHHQVVVILTFHAISWLPVVHTNRYKSTIYVYHQHQHVVDQYYTHPNTYYLIVSLRYVNYIMVTH